MVLEIIRFVAKLLPPRLLEIIYAVVLRPKPLRRLAHKILLAMLPPTVEVDGITLCLNPTDPVLSSALAFGIYENYEREVFGQFCREGATVVDVGANVGLYTAIAAAKVGKGGKVVSIEPHPESFRLLRRSVEANGLTQVRGHNVALGDGRKTVDLFVTDDNKADSRVYDASGKRRRVRTDMFDLDNLLAAGGITRVDLIKMDIQGAEGLALRGMANTLARNPNIVLFMELWPWGIEQTGASPAACLRELLHLGFEFKEIDEGKRRLVDVDNVEELIARHDELQYTGVDFRRSHTNLICVRGNMAGGSLSSQEHDTAGEDVEQARSLAEPHAR
jgi:FkbM family methyltransferase